MDEELFRRAEDLARRCQKSGTVTATAFLTPAQSRALEHWHCAADCSLLLHGGYPGAERRAAFFLPDWMPAEDFDPGEQLCALELTARFGSPGHRDYLGAILGLGVNREWLGDILIEGETAYLFCLPSVKPYLLLNLDKVGRWGVKSREIALEQVPAQERQLQELTFSVKSLRLDAVSAGMFHLSRSAAAEAVSQGLVTLNYNICQKPDAPVREGDILSLRGRGKGAVLSAGDTESRKGRLFVKVGIYQ